MKNLSVVIARIAAVVASLGLIAMGFASIASPSQAATIPQTPALYDGYLASNIGKSDTSMTLSTATTRDGSALSGYYCFTIDVNLPTVEYVCGTASGTSVTGMTRGVSVSDPAQNSLNFAFSHRRFGSVTISDYPTIQILAHKLTGTDTLDNKLTYTNQSAASFTSSQDIINRAYADSLAFGSIPAASETASGFVELAIGSEAAATTLTGGSGARLVLPTSIATSTYNAATAANVVPVTKGTGKIDENFIPSTLANPYTFTATSTYTATSSLKVGAFSVWSGIGKQIQVFSAEGTSTFPVPSGITRVSVEEVGGGGGGVLCGGGAGGYVYENVDVTGTSSIQVHVGEHGSGSNTAGTAGNWSTFGTNGFYNSASGGTAGGSGVTCGSGTGGDGAGGDINTHGGDGFPYALSATTPHAHGGNGGSSFMGGGGAGNSGSGSAGGNYGGGGGGEGDTGSTGGNGAGGIVIVRW